MWSPGEGPPAPVRRLTALTLLARADEQSLTLWDLPEGKERTVLNAAGQLTVGTTLRFSPDGKQVLLAGYLRAVKQGQAPSRRELLAHYPDLAPELAAFLADSDLFDRLTAPLRQALAGPARLAQGTVIDQYDVLEEIGHGGMGYDLPLAADFLDHHEVIALRNMVANHAHAIRPDLVELIDRAVHHAGADQPAV